jgi:hypothetical protein
MVLFKISVCIWLLGLLKMFMVTMPASSAATRLTDAKMRIKAETRIIRFFFKISSLRQIIIEDIHLISFPD